MSSKTGSLLVPVGHICWAPPSSKYGFFYPEKLPNNKFHNYECSDIETMIKNGFSTLNLDSS